MTTAYPKNDAQFEEHVIQRVDGDSSSGYSIKTADWSFFVPADSPVTPSVGMTARFYGKGFGYMVRGLFLAGQEVFYRTEAEDAAYQDAERYGKDAADLIRKWDAGEVIWTLEMCGLSPGYEQAIQVTAIEFAREGLDVPLEGAAESHDAIWSEVCNRAMKRIAMWGSGLSGAQFGAAKWLSWQWVHGPGPIGIAKNAEAKGERDRLTMVSKNFPHSGPLTNAATELLAALQLALDILNGKAHGKNASYARIARLWIDWELQARAAIAKATGGEQ